MSNISRRYAKAMVDAAQEHGVLAELEATLCDLAEILDKRLSDFSQFMRNPAFQKQERIKVIETLAKTQKLAPIVARILVLLVENDRFALLPQIYQAFVQELDQRLGRSRATITSAEALNKEQVQQVIEALSKRLGKTIISDLEIDPSVLGGVRATIGGLSFDGTIQTRLKRLENDLLSISAAAV